MYVLVQVWPTKQSFLKHINGRAGTIPGYRRREFSRDTEGTCGRYTVWQFKHRRQGRMLPCFAIVNLWRGRLGIGVVTHELLHATIAWAWRVKLPMASIHNEDGTTENEERFCYAHGELCRQFMVKGLRPGGVYDDTDTATPIAPR